jgi:signal transduction histidine kinase
MTEGGTGSIATLQEKPRRFRQRVFFYILSLSLLTSVVSGATYYSRQVQFIEKDRALRAHTLLTSLATQAELGAYAGDAVLCDRPVRRTAREEDVVLAGIYDPSGKEILRFSAPSIGTPAQPPMEILRRLLKDPDAPPLRLPSDSYDDLWAPIVTTARAAAVAASSEPGGAVSQREVVGLARVGLSFTPAREQLQEVVRTGAYLTAGLLVLGALAALLIAGRISDPIVALARGADEIRGGNLDITIDIKSEDEIGMLADSFNRMTTELKSTMAKLATLNRNLEGEVSRRTDEIRRSAEFTEVLNAPIAAQTESSAQDDGNLELTKLLRDALVSLEAGTGVKEAAVLLEWEEGLDFELQVAAVHGAEPRAFGGMPTREQLAPGRPIKEPGRAIVPILFRGEPDGAIVLNGSDLEPHAVEFAARAAGQLAIAIANARGYAALRHLANELTQRNQELTKQRDQLSEMNRLKSEFLANVSHELRTPLNAVLGYTELMAEGVYGEANAEQREALSGIDESSRNLLTLINQILDLSKVESGKIELYVTEVAVHEVAQAVAAESLGLTTERPYRVQVVCPKMVIIRTDRAKMQQILTNLVSNAVKFTEEGSVTLEAHPQPGGGCTVHVRDTGIGIKREDQELIFEEFRQVDGSSTRRYQGTGLGLAIARRFAHLLQGTLTVESALGGGSTFTLTLPEEPRPRGAAAGPPPPPGARRPSPSRPDLPITPAAASVGRTK